MRYGFDIDDTLINLREHAFHIYKNKLNKEIEIEVFHAIERVEIHEPFGLDDNQGKSLWNLSLEEIYYTDCPIFPGALETLQHLAERGDEIYYITARPKEHGERTKQWLTERGFPIHHDRFFYGMQDHEKVHIIRDLQLDHYVDDKPTILHTLKGNKTKLYLKDQPYNRHLDDFPRINNWTDRLF